MPLGSAFHCITPTYTNHGDLVAAVLLEAGGAVLPDLVGEAQLGHLAKAEAAEEAHLEGEGEQRGDAEVAGLVEEGLDEEAAQAPALEVRVDGHGNDLGHVGPGDM